MTYIAVYGNYFTGQLVSIPSSAVTFWILRNKIEGSIPELPRFLTSLHIAENLFTGSLPALPPSLISLNCYGNYLSGEMPFIPLTVTILRLGFMNYATNRINGSVMLYMPKIVDILGNLISKVVITNSSLLTECNLSKNRLLYPYSVSNLTMCTVDPQSTNTIEYLTSTLDSTMTSLESTVILPTKILRTRRIASTTDVYMSTIVPNKQTIQKIQTTSIQISSTKTIETTITVHDQSDTHNWFIPPPSASLATWSLSGVAILIYILFGLSLTVYICTKYYKKDPDDESVLTVLSFKKRMQRKQTES